MPRAPVFPNILQGVVYRRRGVLLVILVLLVTAGVGSWWFTAGRFTTAPSVTLVTEAAAREAVDASDLGVNTRTEYSERVGSGLVISTDPSVGTRLLRGDTVELLISLGPEPIAIANYEGRESAMAGIELEDAGFQVKVVQENSATVEKGLVISQTPSTGNGKRDDVITVVESLGPVMVELPNVRYESVEDATLQLEKLGFKVEVKYVMDFALLLMIATGTEPGRGTMVAQGSTVILLVA